MNTFYICLCINNEKMSYGYQKELNILMFSDLNYQKLEEGYNFYPSNSSYSLDIMQNNFQMRFQNKVKELRKKLF